MPPLTAEEQIRLGVTPPAPGEKEIDPKTRITKLAVMDRGFRKRLTLSEEKKTKVKNLLYDCYDEWRRNSAFLNTKLKKYNNRLEGITTPKTYPWPGACSLSIPLIEIHILSLHALIESTILDNDPVWYVRDLLPTTATNERVDPNVEWFLNFVAKVQLKLDEKLSEIFYNACQHPLSIAVMDWMEEIERQYQVEAFGSIEEFQNRFPSAKEAGCSDKQYQDHIDKIRDLEPGEQHPIRVEEDRVEYRGPSMRVVELKDLVRCPVAAPNLKYTIFHGDQFRQRAAWLKKCANSDEFDPAEVEAALKDPGKTKAMDEIAEQQDRIEGISSSRSKSDEYDFVRGNLRIALEDDERDENGKITRYAEEKLYKVVFHPSTKALLRIEEYPYWHNRINYITFRIRKKSNRLLGRCVTDMLWDINEEVDTQHHLRIDSRAITTVPSFKKLATETDLDLSRKDQHFFPGVVFTVRQKDGFNQLQIAQTDMGSSLQEEQTLFQVAEWLVGNSPSLRSGTPTNKDPRASGKKAMIQLQQSNVRVDDYIRELLPGTNEVGKQSLELYYQFSPTSLIPYSQYDEQSKQWLAKDMQRSKLRNKNMHIKVARTSVMDNPDSLMQRYFTFYQLFQKEPLIGGVLKRRHELLRRVIFSSREKDPSVLLPPIEEIIKEMQQQQAQAEQDPAAKTLHDAATEKTGGGGDDEPTGKRQGGPDMTKPPQNKK